MQKITFAELKHFNRRQNGIAMSEQQADYDATSDTDHAQPTPGPWTRQHPEKLALLVDAESGEHLVACMATDIPFEEAEANARLIAAAGTAATKMPEG
jgi:hypothetical protein